jgi:drug/metabolite transporter (DMT)-like permease
MQDQSKAYIFASLSVLCWSTVATAFKIALTELHYTNLLLLSNIVSIITLLIILMFEKKFSLLKGQSLNQVLYSILMGFLNPFLYYIILFKAYSLLPAQEALTLNYTWAIVVSLLSIPILKQKIKLSSFFALLISFSGVAVITTKGNLMDLKFENPEGVALALSSSLVWGLFWVLSVKDSRDGTIKLFMNFVFGILFILIHNISMNTLQIPSLKGFISASYVGLFEMGITFVFWLKALKYSDKTVKISNLVFLSPFLSLFFISLVLKEQILYSSFVGLLLIVSGVIVQNLIKNTTKNIH